MHVNKDSPVYDLALRLSGLALVVFGAVAILQLYHLVHVPRATRRHWRKWVSRRSDS